MMLIYPMKKVKKVKKLLAATVYLLVVLAVFLTISILCMEKAVTAAAVEPGVTDLRDFDFTGQTARIAADPEAVSIYPGVFYTVRDFSGGYVTQEASYDAVLGDYGTIRMVVKLPPAEVYAVAAKNVAFSQRLFVDGREIGSMGQPAETMEEMTAEARRYTESFYVSGETTEIIIHYAGFIHANGGSIYPMLLGRVQNVARIEHLNLLFEGILGAALLTAALFFFGLFLFFSSRQYFLWFSLLCACTSLLFWGINNNALLVLLPDVAFPVFLRLAYMGTCWIGLFGALYFNGLFPGAANRWAIRGFVCYCAAVTVFLGVAPTPVFTRYPMQLAGSYVAFLGYLVTAVIVAARRRKLHSVMTQGEGVWMLAGMVLYTVFAGINVYSHQYAVKFFGWEYQMVGIMLFLFLNLLILTLNFARAERELDKSRAVQREMAERNRALQRLNQIRTSYLGTLTHEMKTPLAGIRAAAQYTKARMKQSGALDGETDRGLDEIAARAGDLAAFAGRLLKFSTVQEGQLDFQPVEAAELFRQAADATAPILVERRNDLKIKITDKLPPLLGAFDLLSHVLINLIANADRHCQGQEIVLQAVVRESMAELSVTDPGSGIPPDLLREIFHRGVSGDGSSGLGLAICREIVESHGGRIYIDSQEGTGTRVWFTIPLAKEEHA